MMKNQRPQKIHFLFSVRKWTPVSLNYWSIGDFLRIWGSDVFLFLFIGNLQ